MYGGGAASRGFILLEEVIRSVSSIGLWSMGILFAVVLVLAFTSPSWWPAMNRAIVLRTNGGGTGKWFSDEVSPFGGAVTLFTLYFLLFPLWSLVATDPNAWWVFLIFGWGSAGIIVYVRHFYRRFVNHRN